MRDEEKESIEKIWKKERGRPGTLRGFVEDGGSRREEARKECHFRSHDTTGPAGHFALFLFSARRARPDLSTSSFSLTLYLPPSSTSSRLTRCITNRLRTRETDAERTADCFSTFVNEFVARGDLRVDNFERGMHLQTIDQEISLNNISLQNKDVNFVL